MSPSFVLEIIQIVYDSIRKITIVYCVINSSYHLSTKEVTGLPHISLKNTFKALYFWLSTLWALPSPNLNVEFKPPCVLLLHPKGYVEHPGNPIFCEPSSCTSWAFQLELNRLLKYIYTVPFSQIKSFSQVYFNVTMFKLDVKK